MPVNFDAIFNSVEESVEKEQSDVEVDLLVDDSGSMSDQAAEVRAGLQKLKEVLGPYASKVRVRTFTQKDLPFERLTDYRPDYPNTPLYKNLLEMIREGSAKTARRITVVVTDGGDNDSRGNELETLKRMIPQLEAEKGWHFLWAANRSSQSLASASAINIKKGKTMSVESAGNAKDALVAIADAVRSHISSGDTYQETFFS